MDHEEQDIGSNQFWVMVWLLAAVVVCTLILSITYYFKVTTLKFIENGYVEGTLQGHEGCHWIKPAVAPKGE